MQVRQKTLERVFIMSLVEKERFRLLFSRAFRLVRKVSMLVIYKILHKPFLLRVEYHIVDHCNLNCKACAHFSSISPETYRDIAEFEKDIACLSSKVRIEEFRLMGGEPLLHPDIIKFFQISRKYLVNSKITLVSNCILLKKMPPAFWNAMREYNIWIEPTVYPPMKKDFDDIIRLIHENKIVIMYIPIADTFWAGLNRNGTNNADYSHKKCTQRMCHHLRNGRLYLCPTTCYIDYYNTYFRANIPKDIGVDIYKTPGGEIVKHVTTTKEVCKYCTNKVKVFDWNQSRRIISEWDGEPS